MSSSAPKRRLDVRQQSAERPLPRRGSRRTRRSLRPSFATIGAASLVLAGVGAVSLSGGTEPSALAADYQQISVAYTGGLAADGNEVDVSRTFDRKLLEEQTQAQAQQVLASTQQLAQATQARADQLAANQWVLPVTGYRITAKFGQRSSLWSSGRHTGLDFAGPSGSTIVAVAAGTITSAGYEGAYGNRTVLTLDDGTEIWFAHQSRIVVKVGQQVSPGQAIGYTGSTGNTTGPHLHLEVHPDGGDAVDPLPVLREHNVNP